MGEAATPARRRARRRPRIAGDAADHAHVRLVAAAKDHTSGRPIGDEGPRAPALSGDEIYRCGDNSVRIEWLAYPDVRWRVLERRPISADRDHRNRPAPLVDPSDQLGSAHSYH